MGAMPRRILLGLALVAAIALAYRPVWHAGFVWDDDAHLTANPCVVGPLGLKEAWTTPAANYFPLVITDFWFLYRIFGANPLPYHLLTLALHMGCALLLWNVLAALGVRGAWLGAALWALHPVQSESVAWISEFTNTQSALFFLLSARAFLAWVDGWPPGSPPRADWRYFASCLAAAAAITSKPSTVVLPLVLLLCLWWKRRPWRWSLLGWIAPYFTLGLAMSVWTVCEQAFYSGALGTEWNESIPQRLLLAGRAVWFYLLKLACPYPLIFVYPKWTLDAARPLQYLPLLAAVAAGVLLWRLRSPRARPVRFAAAAYVILVLPVLGWFNVYYFRYSLVADHFQYLGSMAPLALLGAGLTTAARLGEAGGVLLAAVCGLLTYSHAGAFQSNISLWEDTLRKDPLCWMAHNNLGVALAHIPGREAEAIAHTRRAIEINPDDAEAQYNLATAIDHWKGSPTEAVEHYELAVRLDPRWAPWHYRLAWDLTKVPGRMAEAEAQYRAALRIDPAFGPAHRRLADLLARSAERMPEAIDEYEAAIRLGLDDANLENNLGMLLYLSGRQAEGIAHLKEALRLQPAMPQATANLERIEAKGS